MLAANWTSTEGVHFDDHHDIKSVSQVIKKVEVSVPPFFI